MTANHTTKTTTETEQAVKEIELLSDLTAEEVCAVKAYIRSLRAKAKRPMT